MAWQVGFVNEAAFGEVATLPRDVRASFERIAGLIRELGLEHVREPYVKHVEGKLWEIRLKGKDGIARSLYVTATGRRVVVLRTFVKKTQKIPQREIRLALERARGVT